MIPITDQFIFVGEGVVGRILVVRISPSVTDSNGLQLNIWVVLLDVVGCDSRDIVSGIALSSNIEVSSLKLRILF